jgi:hypothetical protein
MPGITVFCRRVLAMYATVATTAALSLVVGQALCSAGGASRFTWAAPGVGLGALLCIASAAVRLPGHGWLAFSALLAAGIAAAAYVRRRVAWAPVLRQGLWVAAGALLIASIPFFLNARFGPLGKGVQDDLGFHLAWAEALQHGDSPFALINQYTSGYPVAPESLAAAMAGPFGGVQSSLIGLFVAVPVLTGLTALGLLRNLSPGWRTLGAVVAAMPYTAASYFAQGSVKEPLLALLALSLVALLLDRPDPTRMRAGLPLGALLAAVFLEFSYPGALVALALVATWLAGEPFLSAVRRMPPRVALRACLVRCRELAPAIALAVLILGLALALDAARLGEFKEAAGSTGKRLYPGGNFSSQISVRMVFGSWFGPDFRFAPLHRHLNDLASVFAIGVSAYSAAWWMRRRDWTVPLAVAVLLAVAAYARHTSAPYFSAKWLVVPAPLIIAMVVGATLARGRHAALRAALGVVFSLLAAWSTLYALRRAPVGERPFAAELISLRPLLRSGPTLFLPKDNYLRWELLGVPLSTPHRYGDFHLARPFSFRSNRRPSGGGPQDFDEVDPRLLDRFRYVVLSRSAYGSVPSFPWSRVRTTRFYEVWERRGPTGPREVLPEGDAPGALLDCRRPRYRRLARGGGRAAIRPVPATGTGAAWRFPSGRRHLEFLPGYVGVPAGMRVTQRLRLQPGTAEVSLQYTSPTPVDVRIGGQHLSLPANLQPVGQYWSAGAVRVRGGRLELSVSPRRLRRASLASGPLVGGVAVTSPARPVVVPLRRACGRYVDWYAPS